MFRRVQHFTVFLLAALPLPALAAGPTLDEAARYADCVALVDKNPDAAFEEAQVWISRGGGVGAKHCEALALVALEIYDEAAMRLGELADNPGLGAPEERAAILDQAGNAWILAGAPGNAVMAFNAALKLSPGNPDVLLDLSRAHAAAKDYTSAETALDRVLILTPERVSGWVLRASARRAQGRLADARSDVERALAIEPGNPAALVERGAIRLEQGDEAGARADWLEVARLLDGADPASEDATMLDEARRYLEALDVDKG